MEKKYLVTLTTDEREQLTRLISKGKAAARKLAHARILLKAEQNLSDSAIARAVEVGRATVERVRKRFVEEGMEAALDHLRPAEPPVPRKLDGAKEAQLIALACSHPPAGQVRWTLRLLAGKMVELEYVNSLSRETVRRTLKKTLSSPGSRSSGAYLPRRVGSSSGVWRTCWKSTPGPTTRAAR